MVGCSPYLNFLVVRILLAKISSRYVCEAEHQILPDLYEDDPRKMLENCCNASRHVKTGEARHQLIFTYFDRKTGICVSYPTTKPMSSIYIKVYA